MEIVSVADVQRRVQCAIALLVRGQIEEHLDRAPERAQTWLGGLLRVATYLEDEELLAACTPEEKALFDAPFGAWSRTDMSAVAWRIEGLAVLLHALGRYSLPRPFGASEPVDAHAVQAVSSLLPGRAELVPGEERPDADELDRLRRTMAIWRWRARSELQHRRGGAPEAGASYEEIVARAARRAAEAGLVVLRDGDLEVHGQAFARISESALFSCATVALERGRAADWLCGKAAWDAPPEL